MKTLSCTTELRELIREAALDKESVDATLKRLLDSVGDKSNEYVFTQGQINIHVSDETYNRLVECKLHGREPLTRVIRRLLMAYDELNNEVFNVMVNDVEMSFDEFEKEFKSKLNILFTDDYKLMVICTPTGEVVGNMKLSFNDDVEKNEFIRLFGE